MPLGERRILAQVAIGDDHNLAGDGLRDMLAHEPDIEAIGETANGLEAVTLCSRLRPDVVLIDVRMPQMDGLTAPRETKQKHPKTIVIMVTLIFDATISTRGYNPL